MPRAPRAPAVVVVTWSGGDWLARCVAALRPQVPAADLLVVVARPDAVPLPAGVAVVQAPAPEGYAAAANRGLARWPGRDVLLLNDDTACAPGTVAALAAAAARHGPGIYQPRIALAGCGGAPSTLIDNTGHRLFFDGFNLARERGLPRERSTAPPCGEVGAFSGAAVLFTAEVLAETGGFDAELGAFGEDLDLSLRARRRGHRIRFVDNALVEHALGHSYGRAGHRKIYLVERNRVRAGLRSLPWTLVATMPLWTALRLGALGLGAAAGRGIGATAGPTGAVAALAGGLAGVLGLPRALAKRRQDRPDWQLGERAMWAHLLRHHARPEDFLRRPAPAPGGGSVRAGP